MLRYHILGVTTYPNGGFTLAVIGCLPRAQLAGESRPQDGSGGGVSIAMGGYPKMDGLFHGQSH